MHYGNHMMTIEIHLKSWKFKYLSNFMLIYVKILKLSDCLNILNTAT